MKFILKIVSATLIGLFYTAVLFASGTFHHNLLSVDKSPNRTWVNWITLGDSIVTVNISANNMINDSSYAGWINIDPNTFLEIGNRRYKMTGVDGIAIAPAITRFDRPNQTITFSIRFPCVNPINESFSLIENDSSEWRFNGIKLHQLNGSDSNTYLAPHTFSRQLYSFSDSLMRRGEYENAIEANSNVMSYIINNDIKADNLLATTAYVLAGCNNHLHNDSSTIEFSNLVIKLYQTNHWKEDVSLARMYGVLADVYAREEKYIQAIRQGNEAIRIHKDVNNEGSLDLALSLGKVASYYERTGDYDQAISLAENGLMIREKYKENANNNLIPVAVNLCRYYYIKQRYADALKLSLVYKNEDTKKVNLDAYIQLCAVCSHSYQSMGNEKNASEIAEEGFNLIMQYYPNNKSIILNFLDFLSLTEKISIQNKYLKNSTKNEFYFGIMQNLALDYFNSGATNEAIRLQESCLSQRAVNSVHDDAKECEGQNHLLYFYLHSDNFEKYLELKDLCLNKTKEVFGKYSYDYAELLRTVSTYLYEKEDYYEAFLELNNTLDIYKFLIIRDFSKLSYDDRELLWRTYEDWFDSIFLDCYLRALYSNTTQIDKLNALLYDNILFLKGLLLNSQIAHNANKNISKTFEERLENSELVSSFLKNGLYGSYSDILKGLDSESIAIEFVDAENTGEIIALCLLPEKSFPVFNYICKEDELNELLKGNASVEDYNHLIWDKLSIHLKGKTKVFVSLDGMLNIIPIENYGIGCGLFEPNTTIYRLSSSRNIIQSSSAEMTDYLLVGGLNYEHNGPLSFENIPETREEVYEIAKLLDGSNLRYTVLQGTDGTKANIESQLQKQHSVVHLATHSYYWKENKIPNKNIERMMGIMNNSNHNTDKRLVRSGIVLSSSPKDQEVEILSSYDIAGLNLKDVQLIVLPNCKSGSGDITKDGIIGLQRAFKEAQAGSILMSLWNADDIATRLLMVEFYRNYLSGKNIHRSLQDAQKYIKNYVDEKGNKMFESPEYWAGFIILD